MAGSRADAFGAPLGGLRVARVGMRRLLLAALLLVSRLCVG